MEKQKVVSDSSNSGPDLESLREHFDVMNVYCNFELCKRMYGSYVQDRLCFEAFELLVQEDQAELGNEYEPADYMSFESWCEKVWPTRLMFEEECEDEDVAGPSKPEQP